LLLPLSFVGIIVGVSVTGATDGGKVLCNIVGLNATTDTAGALLLGGKVGAKLGENDKVGLAEGEIVGPLEIVGAGV
jgi:hypothetical protein